MRNRFALIAAALVALILLNVGFGMPGAAHAGIFEATRTISAAPTASGCEHPHGPCGSKTTGCDIACPLQGLATPQVDLPVPRPVTGSVHYPVLTMYGQGHVGSPSAPPPRLIG